MKNDRFVAMNNTGANMNKYFSLVVNESIPAGSTINVEVSEPEIATAPTSSVAEEIISDGYVRNSKIHRRWITAQYMRMLNSAEGWHAYLRNRYSYMYQFDMMFEEIRVLSKLEKRDRDTYEERRQFFSLQVVRDVLKDYLSDLHKYIDGREVKHCKGRAYITLPYAGHVFVSDCYAKVFAPIENAVNMVSGCRTYREMAGLLPMLRRVMVELPYQTSKSRAWFNAFQLEGAYYTLRNLIMFHDVKIVYNGRVYGRDDSIELLRTLPRTYKGYQMNALLKKTIAINHFDFKESVRQSYNA